jgi:hypothetical protein
MDSLTKTLITPFDFATPESLPNYMFTLARLTPLTRLAISLQYLAKPIVTWMNGSSGIFNSQFTNGMS